MNVFRRLGDFLSDDWWKGLAVIATAAGIIVASVLTYGIFRLTQSNLDLARSRDRADLQVNGVVYIPVIDAVPQFEGNWLVRLHIVNYGPASAAGFYVAAFTSRGPLIIDPDTIHIFDSSLREITNPFLASATAMQHQGVVAVTVDATLVRQGETLDVVVEGSPAADLSEYARALDSEGKLWPLAPDLPYISSGSLASFYLDACVFDWFRYEGKNVNVSFYPGSRSEWQVGDPLFYDCPAESMRR